MTGLAGQTAIVAGASSGMGRATALALAKAGCRVLAAARREEVLRELAAEAAGAGGEIVVQRADASNKADVEAMVRKAVDLFGRVDTLVNTVGTNTPNRALAHLTDEDWHHLIDTNLHGAYYITRAILPQMRQQGGGLIIHVTSVSGAWPDWSGIAYQAAKRGVIGLAHATMLEERLNGIRVSVILPGLCDTPLMGKRRVPPTREVLDRALQPEDIAAACLFLASLPSRTYVPELTIMPGGLQCLGQTAS
ncbi:MAG: SDR family oxidoreductase [Sphingomonadaceae bacterium]